ncbi:four helix bundle protein [Candidatus Peregrinibacteria bacterium]|nr:four helix bundle protein [Candidatus Peregrinibacteria bacterium]
MSGLVRLPFANSRQACKRFSSDIISSKEISNCFLPCPLLKPPPPSADLPIIHKLIQTYKVWHETIPHLPKTARYGLGSKIDNFFLETIEFILISANSQATEKAVFLGKASGKLDLLKFFLQIAWEIKALDNKKYLRLSECLVEIGRMLGGWIKQMKAQ